MVRLEGTPGTFRAYDSFMGIKVPLKGGVLAYPDTGAIQVP